MDIKPLVGPQTHICWTPDSKSKEEQELVVLIKWTDFKAMKNRIAFLEKENNEYFHKVHVDNMGA